MIISIFLLLLAGFILSTPPGVINLVFLELLSQNKRKTAFNFALGSSFADVAYAWICLYFASLVKDYYEQFYLDYQVIIKSFEFVLAIGIIAFGIYRIRNKTSISNDKLNKNKNYFGFLGGLALASTHIVVPSFLPSYSYFAIQYWSLNLVEISQFNTIFLALLFGVGAMSWFGLWLFLHKLYQSKISESLMSKIRISIGLLLILVGVAMLVVLSINLIQ